MVLTEDDEDQIMFDLYDGLDTFAQKTAEKDRPQDDVAVTAAVKRSNSSELKRSSGSINQFREVGAEESDNHVTLDDGIPDDEDDGLVFLVEDDDYEGEPGADHVKKDVFPTERRKPGGWTTRYQKKERVIYVGAPSSEALAMASTEPKKECFCLVSGVPWWVDVQELNHIAETGGGIVAFSKILSDPITGESLGAAIVEFVDRDSCDTFCKTSSHLTATVISDDIFEFIKDSPLYREGLFKAGFINRVVARLGISLRRNAANIATSDLYHEIEFEVQQQEMIRRGEFDAASKVFPWLNLNVVKLLGYAKRYESAGSEDTYNITNHLEAYKHKQSVAQNYFNVMMPNFMMADYVRLATNDAVGPEKSAQPHTGKSNKQGKAPGKKNKQASKSNSDHPDSTSSDKKKRSRSPSRKKERDRDSGGRRDSPGRRSRRRRSPSRGSNRNSRHRDRR
ncbi:ubiquitin carboxyl-terminal hydrolase [Babesia caballi]|uniref:Ubiquitin carboxyl-terminal hydrolase n=1 Tax=Babesia caballi TaxID=5871 RepID=A0AAV4LTR6_BABCB|nr:ubiquitin carboxyl-terminal hydrolase [Babesia caballi]